MADGRKFAYHYAQQQAIETLVYLYEVAQVRRQKDLIETFAGRQDLKLLQYDQFARYCIKMATGSGKVMVLAIAWHYFNAVAEARDDFAKTFLLIALNVIVFERLRSDFRRRPGLSASGAAQWWSSTMRPANNSWWKIRKDKHLGQMAQVPVLFGWGTFTTAEQQRVWDCLFLNETQIAEPWGAAS